MLCALCVTGDPPAHLIVTALKDTNMLCPALAVLLAGT